MDGPEALMSFDLLKPFLFPTGREFLALTAAILLLDALLGDPGGRWHPIARMGRSLTFYENWLRARGWAGYGGGVLLFGLLTLTWVAPLLLLLVWTARWHPLAVWTIQAVAGFFLLAQRSLLDYGRAICRAARENDLTAARRLTAGLVGRDTDRMTADDCRRAAVESIAESLTDGVVAPLFYLMVAGVPGMLLFKIVSTMDSMVGYKTPRYRQFGWCGARTDDALNYLPARISYLLLGLAAWLWPGASGRAAWRIGWQQHAIVPGPNAGWSEAAAAGALRRRLVGPIWKGGVPVTDRWLGDPADSTACGEAEVRRISGLVVLTTLLFVAAGGGVVVWVRGW